MEGMKDVAFVFLLFFFFSHEETHSSRKHAYIVLTPLNPTFI